MAKDEVSDTPLREPRRTFLDWAEVAEGRASRARSIILNLLAVAIVFVSLPILARELISERIVIAPLSIPDSIEETGLSGEVTANRLWDAWARLNREVAVAKETRDLLPSSQRIQFAIPDSGLSFDSLIHHVRDFIGLDETTLSGEFTCTTTPCELSNSAIRLRVVGSDLSVITLDPIGDQPLDAYFRQAMVEVLLKLDPVRGIMATSLGNEERAIAELRKLVRADHPDRQWALMFAGVLLGNAGDRKAALASLDEAIRTDPSFALPHAERASLLLSSDDLAGARASVDQALALAPRDARNHIRLAQIEAKAGRFEAAFAAYAEAARLEPNWPQIPLGVGVAQHQKGDLAAARQAFEQAIEIDPDFLDARQMVALYATLDGDAATALKHQRVIARIKPDDAEAQAGLAAALELGGSMDEAEAAYKRATGLQPSSAAHWMKLGLLQQKRQRHADALESLATAARLDPSLADIWFAMADTQRLLGKVPDARTSYERYVREQPDGLYAAIAATRLKAANLEP
jgi:tetratricopeptide (TPR) repeat protein